MKNNAISYQIFVDGSYRSSRHCMGIGVLWIKDGKKVYEYSKKVDKGTNNIAELSAIYIALKSIKNPINSLEIVSDSEYSIGVVSNPNWNPKKNISLINKIKEQLKITQTLVSSPIKFTHTRGHQSDDSEYTKYNNRVDFLAQEASKML